MYRSCQKRRLLFIGLAIVICLLLEPQRSKSKGPADFYSQAFNSRAAVVDKLIERSEGTACEARRTSTHSFKLRRVCVRMCRATNGEPRAKYCGAAFAGSRGAALSLLFFCRRFLFQIKRKCRNAVSVYRLIIVGRKGSS